jgi:hypothetical protein
MSRFDIRTRTGLIYPIIQGLVGINFDPDAQAFFNRVSAAGGTLNSNEQVAVNQLVLDLKSYNLWSLMLVIYPMVGSSAASCAQNLKSSSFTGTFAGGWTFASTGVTGNGTSGYMNTALNTSTNLTKTSAHLSIYTSTSVSSASQYDVGNSDDAIATVNPTYLITRYVNNNCYFGIADQSYGTNVTVLNSYGFTAGSTNGSATQKIYKNGSVIQSGTAGSGNLSNSNLYIGANNSGGTATFFSNKQYSFASIGTGISDTNATNFYTAVQAFQTTLARQV